MADLGFTVSVDDLPDALDFSPFAAGPYTGVITNSKLLPTNDTKDAMQAASIADYDSYRKLHPKASGYLALEFDIQENGRKVFHNLNLINDNEITRSIAAGQLKQILTALNMKTMTKSEELHGKRVGIEIGIKPAKEYFDKKTGTKKPGQPQNECKKFYAATGAASTPVQQTAATSSMPKAPWSR